MQTALLLTGRPPRVAAGEIARAGHLIDVAEARDLVDLCRRRPWQGDRTTIHLTSAHNIRDDVWNTLLKVLEEPPPYVEFKLYAPSTDAIPPTIRSRSHITRLDLPDEQPGDAPRLIRLITSGDVLAIIREGDRASSRQEAAEALDTLLAHGARIGDINLARAAQYHRSLLARGANPRTTVKAALLTIALAEKLARRDTAA